MFFIQFSLAISLSVADNIQSVNFVHRKSEMTCQMPTYCTCDSAQILRQQAWFKSMALSHF